ncbi:MAG: hypothetical protein AMJ70_08530 [Dehalococcoidia bacterium SG8_51_3]|nr:MAG: hypothetical protein AMJ70_08530 [Dehalococcoidia bacterium SG8_51_3]
MEIPEMFDSWENVAEFAASGCYFPDAKGDKRIIAMVYVIERLVLPQKSDGYTEREMIDFILDAFDNDSQTQEDVMMSDFSESIPMDETVHKGDTPPTTDEIPKCPECGAGVDRPKCLFEKRCPECDTLLKIVLLSPTTDEIEAIRKRHKYHRDELGVYSYELTTKEVDTLIDALDDANERLKEATDGCG